MAKRQGTTLQQRAEFQRLQALEDAIAYRAARLAAPCPGCAQARGQRCEEHARDLELVDEYRAVARVATAELTRSLATCAREGSRTGSTRH